MSYILFIYSVAVLYAAQYLTPSRWKMHNDFDLEIGAKGNSKTHLKICFDFFAVSSTLAKRANMMEHFCRCKTQNGYRKILISNSFRTMQKISPKKCRP
jgi:hypothetical protein